MPRPLLWVLLFILSMITLEIAIFVQISRYLGFLGTLLLLVVVSVVGFQLLKYQGIKTVVQIERSLTQGKLPKNESIATVAFVIAAILFFIPGFSSDIIGLLLLFPPTQQWLFGLILPLFKRIAVYTSHSYFRAETEAETAGTKHGSGRTIDGKFTRVDDEPPSSHNEDKNDSAPR